MPVGQKPYKYDAYEEAVFRCPSQVIKKHTKMIKYTKMHKKIANYTKNHIKTCYFLCFQEFPYFFTNLNSDVPNWTPQKINKIIAKQEDEKLIKEKTFEEMYEDLVDGLYELASKDEKLMEALEKPKKENNGTIPPFDCEVNINIPPQGEDGVGTI